MDRIILNRVNIHNQRVIVDPYEIEEFKKLLNADLCKFNMQTEMQGCNSVAFARACLFLDAGKCQITLKLANEFIKATQKATMEILGRARN